MKNRIGVILLVLVCLGLTIGLIITKKQSSEEHGKDLDVIGSLSNRLSRTSSDLEEQKSVAGMLEKDLEKSKQALADLTNNYTQVSANLTQTKASLAKTEASLKSTEEDLKKRDARITELETQNQALDKQAIDLSQAITNLTSQITETKRRLASSEGDKAFLEKELKRMMAEKAELERQFNDLTVLRAQVSKLKEELSIARRIEWIRKGLFASGEEKGAQRLMSGMKEPLAEAKAAKPNYDLNVEISSDGKARIIPPPTNAPAATNQPAK